MGGHVAMRRSCGHMVTWRCDVMRWHPCVPSLGWDEVFGWGVRLECMVEVKVSFGQDRLIRIDSARRSPCAPCTFLIRI